ncbi:MAG: hypothetical protein K2H56_00600 [Malacoplasma sp.]|nr:hypothetical protein [Malacoplasma sp.]
MNYFLLNQQKIKKYLSTKKIKCLNCEMNDLVRMKRIYQPKIDKAIHVFFCLRCDKNENSKNITYSKILTDKRACKCLFQSDYRKAKICNHYFYS